MWMEGGGEMGREGTGTERARESKRGVRASILVFETKSLTEPLSL